MFSGMCLHLSRGPVKTVTDSVPRQTMACKIMAAPHWFDLITGVLGELNISRRSAPTLTRLP